MSKEQNYGVAMAIAKLKEQAMNKSMHGRDSKGVKICPVNVEELIDVIAYAEQQYYKIDNNKNEEG